MRVAGSVGQVACCLSPPHARGWGQAAGVLLLPWFALPRALHLACHLLPLSAGAPLPGCLFVAASHLTAAWTGMPQHPGLGGNQLIGAACVVVGYSLCCVCLALLLTRWKCVLGVWFMRVFAVVLRACVRWRVCVFRR